ncbi:MAG: hypothetical protein RL037_1992 [Bacteroidota bacterium]|jgi:hypothetical protein
MNKTELEYTNVILQCKTVFEKKTWDYGTSWRILRPSSLTDQLFIKAQRIRTIQEAGERKVDEPFDDAFMAIVNYCVMAIIQLSLPIDMENTELPVDDAMNRYNHVTHEAFELMKNKNHDYGEAWRDMRVSSLTDLILTKILRIKQIEDNQGITLASEGVEGNYYDMLNYAVFALIHLKELK